MSNFDNNNGKGKISIGTANFNAPTQVGDYNTQNIEMTLQSLIQQINQAQASSEDKTEAKNLLARFLNHPLTCAILGGVAGSLLDHLKQ